jgi:hypothetical protein
LIALLQPAAHANEQPGLKFVQIVAGWLNNKGHARHEKAAGNLCKRQTNLTTLFLSNRLNIEMMRQYGQRNPPHRQALAH